MEIGLAPDFAARLLSWYDKNARDLPWRVSPAARKQGALPDPYHVWLSEVMLQQTTVATVRTRFAEFLRRWPRLKDLAAADEADILSAWAGLGYYARARNLKACANMLAADLGGTFPNTAAELARLPGFGPYTAAAVAAICFDQPVAVVDGNVDRVMARQLALPRPVSVEKHAIRAAVQNLVPERSGDFAQAMMDLGATICAPKLARCEICPVRSGCVAGMDGTWADYPVKPPKKTKPQRYGRVFLIYTNGQILLRRRPGTGLLASMVEPVASPFTAQQADDDPPLPVKAAPVHLGKVRHIFTHFRLELDVFECEAHSGHWFAGHWWHPIDDIESAGLPTVFAKAVKLFKGSQTNR